MKIKTIKLSAPVIILMVIGLFSCSKKSENISPTNEPTAKNRIIKKSGSYEINPAYTVTWEDNSTAIFYAHTSLPDNYNVYVYDENGVLDQIIMADIIIENGVALVNLEDTSWSVLVQTPYVLANTDYSNDFPGNCKKLHGRKKMEATEKCYDRIYNNFCCNASGCDLQADDPALVAFTVLISCYAKHSKIIEIFDEDTQTAIYTN